MKKKRNKKYNPRRDAERRARMANRPMWINILKVADIMRPLDDVLKALRETGQLTVVNDTLVIDDYCRGEVYELLPAAEGFLQFFSLYEERKNTSLDMMPLYTLLRTIGDGGLVTMAEISEAEKVADRMRMAVASLSELEAQDMAKTIQIKQKFEERAADGES